MIDEHIILDGYNVIFRTPELRELAREELERSRNELVRRVAEAFGGRRERITIVFDGNRQAVQGGRSRSGSVRIVFSTPPETADQRIQRLVEDARRVVQGRRRLAFRIVSSDREVAGRARLWGARAIGVKDFLAEVERRRKLKAEERAAASLERRHPRPRTAPAPGIPRSPPGRRPVEPAGPGRTAGPGERAGASHSDSTGRGRSPRDTGRRGRRAIQPEELERKPQPPGQSEIDEWERLFRNRRPGEDRDEDEDET